MYKFSKLKNPNNDYDTYNLEMTVTDSECDCMELIEAFEKFLIACGYGFHQYGDLKIVPRIVKREKNADE
jgi:hypothetical protein